MDSSPFLSSDFDHKQWINDALKVGGSEQTVEQTASDLVIQLQSQMKDVMESIDRSCEDAVHCVPRLLREFETLKLDAVALGDELSRIKENVCLIDDRTNQAIVQLADLDRIRRNAQTAANALRETDRWSGLVQSMDELIVAEDLDQICSTLEGMNDCLTSLRHLPDYEERTALVNRHKNTLESLIAPQLIQSLDRYTQQHVGQSTEDSQTRRLIGLLQRVGRHDAAVSYYTNWLKSDLKSCWDACTAGKQPSTDIYHVLASLSPSAYSTTTQEFCAQLIVAPNQTVPSPLPLQLFYAHVIHTLGQQITLNFFAQDHAVIVLRSLHDALKSLGDSIQSFVFGTPSSVRVDHIGVLLQVALSCCAQLGKVLKTRLPDFAFDKNLKPAESDSTDCLLHRTAFDLTRVVLSPFASIGSRFGQQIKDCFDHELKKLQLAESPSEPAELFSKAIINCVHLVQSSFHCCLELTLGVGLPYLFSSVQLFWESLLAKWTVVLERLIDQMITSDSASGFDQMNGFSWALQLASLTGELSLRCDALVDMILSKSAQLCSNVLANVERFPLFNSPSFPFSSITGDMKSITPHDCSIIGQLIECQAADCRHVLLSLVHTTTITTTTTTESKRLQQVNQPLSDPQLRSNLAGLHRSSAIACRAAITMVRRVALAPMRECLRPVPSLSIWASTPDTGEATLPDLAYLPQDYITKVGQYILALPELLEPYTAKLSPENDTELTTGRGLSECMRLGDPESLARQLSISNTDSPQESTSKSQRSRLNSGGHRLDNLDGEVAAFWWLDQFISGAVSDLLVGSLLHIGSVTNPPHSNEGPASESENEMEDRPSLTPHGARQLDVDLNYLRNLLDDLGISFPGNLLAVHELIRCPEDQYAATSADRPPWIAGRVARLRGIQCS